MGCRHVGCSRTLALARRGFPQSGPGRGRLISKEGKRGFTEFISLSQYVAGVRSDGLTVCAAYRKLLSGRIDPSSRLPSTQGLFTGKPSHFAPDPGANVSYSVDVTLNLITYIPRSSGVVTSSAFRLLIIIVLTVHVSRSRPTRPSKSAL